LKQIYNNYKREGKILKFITKIKAGLRNGKIYLFSGMRVFNLSSGDIFWEFIF